MSLKSRIKVGGVWYKISFKPDARSLHQDKTTADWAYGWSDYTSKLITVWGGADKDTQQITFFHELAHLIVNGYHIKNIRNEDGTHNEDAIDLFGLGLKEAFDSLGIDILAVVKNEKTESK